jgi:peptide/nickel transport system ATP-binding protein
MEGIRHVRQNGRHQPGFSLAVDSLRFDSGESVAIVGPSGSGKSTLLGIAAGLTRPQEGQVLFRDAGALVEAHANRKAYGRFMGFVFQDSRAALNERRSILDIVRDPLEVHGIGSGRRERTETAATMLARLGIDQNRFTSSPASLSGGQRQRVAIARALVHAPKLLLMDEPTSSLDVSVQAGVLETLQALVTGKTTLVMVVHDLAVARYVASRMVVMAEGRVVDDRPTPEVLRDVRDGQLNDTSSSCLPSVVGAWPSEPSPSP